MRSARPTEGETGDPITQRIAWGPGPRASQSPDAHRQGPRALLQGRLSPSLDDVMAMAEPVLQHRMALTFAARADGHTVRGVIAELKAKLS